MADHRPQRHSADRLQRVRATSVHAHDDTAPCRATSGKVGAARRSRRAMTRSGLVDTFARDHLPPREQWPEFLFELPELQFPPRLNCAAELLDRAVARGLGRAALRARAHGVRWTYAELQRAGQPHRARAGRRPGPGARQPRAAARRQLADAGGLLVRRRQGRRHRGRHDAAAARQGADRRSSHKAQITHALCDARLAEELELRAAELPDAAAGAALYGDGAHGLERARRQAGRALRQRRHRRRRHLPDRLHLGHHRPAEGHDALPPRRDGGLRLLAAARAARRAPTTSSSAARRWRSPSAWAGCCCSRWRSAPRTVLLEKATPDALLAAIAQYRATVLLHRADRRTARWRRRWRAHDLSCAAQVRVGRRGAAGRHARAVEGGHRHRDDRRHRLDRDAAHLHLARRSAGARPGATGKPVPGLPRLRARRRGRASCRAAQVGRLAVKGPTGCRYLADERQRSYVQRRLEPDRRRLPASTRTASSSTRRAPTT